MLVLAPVVEAYIKEARKEAIKRIQGGDHIPGFELGPGRRSRAWVDEDAARRYLSGLGVNLSTPTPAAAEKVVKDMPERLWEWVESKSSKLVKKSNPFEKGDSK